MTTSNSGMRYLDLGKICHTLHKYFGLNINWKTTVQAKVKFYKVQYIDNSYYDKTKL